MNEVISKAILSGLGFASLTGDAIRETAQALVKQSKLSEKEGRRLVKDFQQRSHGAQKTLEKKVNAAVRKALKTLDISTSARPKKKTKSSVKRKAGGRRTARTAKSR
jgi:polyhydroxyalkanoate synthesis regulator phasin